MKIPITDILLELRYQKAKNEPVKTEKAGFAAISTVWGNPTLWNRVVRMVALGRVLGGFNGVIESAPFPVSGWTEFRDVAVPPKKSFRQWWDTDEAQDLLARERAKGVPAQPPVADDKKDGVQDHDAEHLHKGGHHYSEDANPGSSKLDIETTEEDK